MSLPDIDEILLVEDSESDARLLKRALQIARVVNPIRHARTTAEAIKHLTDRTRQRPQDNTLVPGIIFLDLDLRDGGGFDILAWIKDQHTFAKTLRIALSQIGDLASIRRAYSLGAHSFLTKPGGQEDIQELIKAYPDLWEVAAPGPISSAHVSTNRRKPEIHRRAHLRPKPPSL